MNTITETKFRELKAEVDRANAEAQRAEGARDQLLDRLKKEFKVKDIAAARVLLKEKTKTAQEAQEAYDIALAAYQKKWKGDEK